MPARASRCSWDTSAEGEMRVMRRAALRLHRSRRLLSDADRPDQTTLAYSMAGRMQHKKSSWSTRAYQMSSKLTKPNILHNVKIEKIPGSCPGINKISP